MSKQQLAWAKQHDWYLGAYVQDGKGAAYVYDNVADKVEVFTDFKALKQWAGY